MLYSFTYGLGLYIQLILTERYPSWIISILIWQYFVFFIHPGLIRHDFHEKKFQLEKYWLFQVWTVSWTELTLIINPFNISPKFALGMSYFILNLKYGRWHCEISCN